jgi:hypothetical protein
MWLADMLTSLAPAIPRIIWLTTLVLVIAQLPIVRKLSGSVVIGNFLLLLFLASNGANRRSEHRGGGASDLLVRRGHRRNPRCHHLRHGWLLKMNGDLLAVASPTNVGGATTVWRSRVHRRLAWSRRRRGDAGNMSATTPASPSPMPTQALISWKLCRIWCAADLNLCRRPATMNTEVTAYGATTAPLESP